MTRKRPISLLARAAAVALVMCCCPVAGLAAAGTAQGAADHEADGSTQQIYLDPDTGEVIPPPDAAEKTGGGKAVPENAGSGRQATTGTQAWKNEEGVHMLTPDPESMPQEQAVHCPDGSLRIGHGQSSQGHDGRQALCAD